ncbi:MAG: hypothetical protein M3Q79_00125 [bacterium]|nr:hypothetical protein [bacterium]
MNIINPQNGPSAEFTPEELTRMRASQESAGEQLVANTSPENAERIVGFLAKRATLASGVEPAGPYSQIILPPGKQA